MRLRERTDKNYKRSIQKRFPKRTKKSEGRNILNK